MYRVCQLDVNMTVSVCLDVVEHHQVDRVATGMEYADTLLAVHEVAESVQTTEDFTAHTEPSAASERQDVGHSHQK